uniref:NADH dehydrogenase subunit 4L n=1 Tax=Vespula flaviceps TaxID=1475057 RepID=A0A649UCY9_9HYME|nr:NADH dehydrogenase subunit 4L [Vespula flaviceps]QGI24286.1 NADH dehydrogenase subunit 4L [Vespula flaviceps]
MNYYVNFGLTISLFLLVLMMFCKYYNHALMVLLCIEFMVIISLMNIYMMMMNFNKDFYLLVFMVMFVIEGILGISLIVMMIRFKGNEYFKNLNLMW